MNRARGHPVAGWTLWARPLGVLALVLFGPLLLLMTPLRGLGINWIITCLLVFAGMMWGIVMSVLMGVAFNQPPKFLGWLEQRLRLWGTLNQGMEKAADRLVTHRLGPWVIWAGVALLALLGLFVVGAFFWAGSSQLYHLPLIMLLPPVLLLAWQAYQLRRERPRSGRDRLLEAAERGDPEACYELGVAYRTGSSFRPRDDLAAAIWFRKAAEAGHSLAMRALADAYMGGHGLLRDPREAARWAEAARRESTSKAGQPMETLR